LLMDNTKTELKRPFVSLNMAQSLDGKITTVEKLKVRIGSPEDRELMEKLRSQADAILIGKGTLIADDPPLIIRNPKYRRQRKQYNKKSDHPVNVVVSSKLDFPIENSDFFNCRDTDKIVITTREADKGARKQLEKFADVHIVAKDENNKVNLLEALDVMRNMGIRHLLLEGGGSINFAMLENNLIDEIYLTLCPFIMGGPAPTIFDGRGFTKEQVRKLELLSVKKGEFNELFLKYRVLTHIADVKKSRIFHKGYDVS